MILTIDNETTIKADGNPFTASNVLCYFGAFDGTNYYFLDIEHSGKPYASKLIEIRNMVESAETIVGFNLKFDLHWIRRYVPNIKFPAAWDCQLGHFILDSQRNPFPSLDKVSNFYSLGSKRNVVYDEYWANGIDTTNIPAEVLTEYLKQDLYLTHNVYLKQYEILKDNKVFKLQCQDLLVLEEMEWNGMQFDTKESLKKAEETSAAITDLDNKLNSLVVADYINWSSSSHISCVLFGGYISIPIRVPTSRTLKSGQIKHGEKDGFREEYRKAYYKPVKKWETLPTKTMNDWELAKYNADQELNGRKKRQRIYSVSEDVLRQLKTERNKEGQAIIDLLMRRSDLEKLLSTYYGGIPKIIEEHGWEGNMVHGQFNQVVARTGRLSSSQPNLQNFAGDVKYLFRSRYE